MKARSEYPSYSNEFRLLSALKRLFNTHDKCYNYEDEEENEENFVGIYQISKNPGEYGIKCYFSEYVESFLGSRGLHVFQKRFFDESTDIYLLDFATTKKLLEAIIKSIILDDNAVNQIAVNERTLSQMFIFDELEKLSPRPVSQSGFNQIGYNPERKSAFKPSISFANRLKEERGIHVQDEGHHDEPASKRLRTDNASSGRSSGYNGL